MTELEKLSDHFQQLSALPAPTKSSLLQQITKVMEDTGAVSSLQNVVGRTKRSLLFGVEFPSSTCLVGF